MLLQDELAIYKNYSELAYAVIIQAAEEYFEYSRAVMRGQSKHGQSKELMQKEHLQPVIDFFNNKTGYYKYYCTLISATSDSHNLISDDQRLVLRGDQIMAKLDEMIADEENYPDDFIHLSVS